MSDLAGAKDLLVVGKRRRGANPGRDRRFLRSPVITGHDPMHELVDERDGECGIAVVGAQIMPTLRALASETADDS